MTATLLQKIEKVVEPLLESEGYELVLAEFASGHGVVRLFIDSQGGVTVDDCAKVSRLVSDVLDAEGISDEISGNFTLEVSSPGLDRPLVKPRDFIRFLGSPVRLTTRHVVAGRRKFVGELVRADEAKVELDVEGEMVSFAYEQIERARLKPVFK